MDNRKIGIFDSGVGGLTVLKKLLTILPNENYLYIGDNKNMPYGDKTKEELYAFSKRIINFFLKQNVKLIIVACNTISATVLEDLQKEFVSIKIIGVIESTVKEIIKENPHNLLIIGTKAMIESHTYYKKINEITNNINIMELSTPTFVPLIETNSPKLEENVNSCLKGIENYDTIVLGCTHYELLQDIIKKYHINIISSSNCCAKEVYSYLNQNHLLGNKSCIKILTTGNKNSFYKISKNIIDYEVEEVDL